MNKCCLHTELSSPEGTRSEFSPGKAVIKLAIDVHQAFYVVVLQEGGGNPKPAQRLSKAAFLGWAARLKQRCGGEIHAVYEACGFGCGLQRQLAALGIGCQVVCPQKLVEQNKRVKTDGLDAEALALVRVPTEEEEQLRAIHGQREPLPISSSTDRVDQIAALATVRCTDRSTSRWKTNPTRQRKRKRSEEPLTTHSPKQMS